MNTLYPPTAPARLYALLLKLRPLQRGTLMPFSGELVHGAFLHCLKNAASEVATWQHLLLQRNGDVEYPSPAPACGRGRGGAEVVGRPLAGAFVPSLSANLRN